MKRRKKSKNIDFLLESRHYRKLNIMLYLFSVIIIVFVYFVTFVLFSKFLNMCITAVTSFILGLYILLNRAFLVKKMSDYLESRKRTMYRRTSKENLKSTLRKVVSKKKLRLKVQSSVSIKEKVNMKVGNLFKDKKKKEKGYIEIK